MKKQSKVSALVLALALLSVSGLANAAFTKGMTKEQAAKEVKDQLKAGKSLNAITAEAKAVGVPAADLTTALIQAGQNPVAVAQVVATFNPEQAAAIQTAATDAAPTLANQIQLVLLNTPGVNPALVTPATAAAEPIVQQDNPQPPVQVFEQNPSQVGSPS